MWVLLWTCGYCLQDGIFLAWYNHIHTYTNKKNTNNNQLNGCEVRHHMDKVYVGHHVLIIVSYVSGMLQAPAFGSYFMCMLQVNTRTTTKCAIQTDLICVCVCVFCLCL